MKASLDKSICPVCSNKSVTTCMLANSYHYICKVCGAEITFPAAFGAKVADPSLDKTIENIKTAIAESNFN